MGVNLLLKSAAVGLAMVVSTVAGASAQEAPQVGCLITELSSSSAATDFYLKAETELLANDNPAGARDFINQMRQLELNCLEEGIALGLSAQIKIRLEDYAGAITDLETSLNKGYIPADRLTPFLLSLSQLHFQEGNMETGLGYMNRWMEAGGQPTRDQKWTLAVVLYQLDRPTDSLVWAEQVFDADGPGATRQVYDFLILLYDQTGNKAKKAELLEQLLIREPDDRAIWDAIAGDYFQADEGRKAFEVQKAMYLGGILKTEQELKRVINFYNSFDAPYHAARILEKEINAGRISKTFENLELLANLYQVAREHKRAIPVIQEAAQQNNSAAMYERLGRSYAEQQEWDKAEESLETALEIGSGLKDRGLAWVLVGQSRYERKDRSGAREAFRAANNRGGRGWLAFMDSEDATAKALLVFNQQQEVTKFVNEQKRCKRLAVLGDSLPEGCATVDARLAEANKKLEEIRSGS